VGNITYLEHIMETKDVPEVTIELLWARLCAEFLLIVEDPFKRAAQGRVEEIDQLVESCGRLTGANPVADGLIPNCPELNEEDAPVALELFSEMESRLVERGISPSPDFYWAGMRLLAFIANYQRFHAEQWREQLEEVGAVPC
jgi:hypothetical protein